MRLKVIIGLWISLIVLASCEERADYLNWSRKVAKFCKYVKYSEESKRYECGPKLGEFYTYIIVHPDYDLPKNPIYPLVAYDGNDNVVMVGGNGRGQIWRMIKFEKWEFVRETEKGMKEVYYDEDEKAFIGLQMGDNKENIKSMAWRSRDGGKSWFRARVPLFNKKEENKTNSVLPVSPVVGLTPKVAPTPVVKPLAKAPVAPAGPKLPVGGIVEAVGGGYVVAIGKVGGKATVWRSIEKVPRDWKETNQFKGVGRLPDSLSRPSDLTKVDFVGGKFEIEDIEGKGWTYEDTKNEWEISKVDFAGGDGTVGSPYKIASAAHLWLVRNHLTSNFELLKDLDLSIITEREGFEPIGEGGNRFRGTFDGKGRKIRNLRIDRPTRIRVGLFGAILNGAVLKNIGLENVDIRGEGNVGGLVGDSIEGTIVNSYAMGKVTGENNVGGLVGLNIEGEIKDSYATGAVEGEKNKVGGLVGWNRTGGTIKNSYATVKVDGENAVGGLVGDNDEGIVKKSYATGRVTGTEARVGGLVGYNQDGGKILKSYATGRVEGARQVGGLVGESSSSIRNSYATGEVIVGGTGVHRDVGGFLGKHEKGEIENSYSTGQVRATAKTIYPGGFVGNCVKDEYKGTNYWKSGSAPQGIGNVGRNPRVIRKLESDLKALDTTVAGSWAILIWNFQAGQYPKLSWQ